MQLYFIIGDDFGEKVLGNLVNLANFCKACNLACNYCRIKYGPFSSDICGVDLIKEELNNFIEDPERYLPKNPPKCDIILPIGIHPDLFAALPLLVEKTEAKAVIVPIENRNWCPLNLQKRLELELRDFGVDYAFPKPFCSLEESGNKIIDEFIDRYKIGKPIIEIYLKGDRIENSMVLRSAPCGSTWYVAQQIKLSKIDGIEQVISNAHHGYPCTASMEFDPELKDTILHKAGYIIREAVLDAIDRACIRQGIMLLKKK
ncbi:MAG: thymidylate synthase [archaeon]|nr:thymidylate synthase [archaeon]MCP8315680.1 thymidylate synthase [archaeon]